MPSISSDSSTKELDLPEVEVLLATFNGERYLSEFLDSLSRQLGVKIHLVVSDDGSTDRTLEIVEEFRYEFASLSILTGPKLGPAKNFYFLIQNSSHSFVALADQDDIWLPEHLQNSINRIQVSHPKASMTATSVWEIDFDHENACIWPSDQNPFCFPRIFFENYIRGCTIVFNAEFRNLLNNFETQKTIMHDWWIGIIGWCFAEFSFSDYPEIIYRLHAGQHVGNEKRNLKNQLRNFKKSDFASTLLEQMYILKKNNLVGDSENLFKVFNLISILESPFLQRIKLLERNLNFRSRWYQNLIVKIFLFLGIPQWVQRRFRSHKINL
jgi:glycosyltransferase involved in cell wall biosynthesis